jgi:transcriptional regulator with XRE-family HTH domain
MHRRHVRVELRKARDRVHMTQQEVADALDWSLSKIIRIEHGSVSVSTTDLRALLALYHVTDEELATELAEAARASRGRPWWHEYRELIRPQFAELLAYESVAEEIVAYNPTLIPALLQGLPYARVLRGQSVKESGNLEQVIELLSKRQQVLDDTEACFNFIVDEAALRRWVGGPGVMRDQLTRLRLLAQRENISLRVLPFKVGAHPSLSGPFVLVKLPAESSYVLFLEGAQGDTLSREDESLIAEYKATFSSLEDMTLSLAESVALIDELTREYAQAEAALDPSS